MPDVQYIGTCSALVEKKGGWYQIQIAVPGKQYPIKADTKLEHLINDAREVRDSGAVATWTVSESESENINPNSGKPYIERRLEKVELGAQTPAGGTPAQPPPEAHHEAIHFADKDRAISRMACLKAAAQVWHGAIANPNLGEAVESGLDIGLEVMTLAGRFEKWIYRDIDPVPFE